MYLAAFPSPAIESRAGTPAASRTVAADEARESFVRIHEVCIQAGQRSFKKGGRVQPEELAGAIRTVQSEPTVWAAAPASAPWVSDPHG